MVTRRAAIRLLVGLAAVFAVAALASVMLAPAAPAAAGPVAAAASPAGPTARITVTSPTSGAAYAAYPTGTYAFPDRSGTFSPALFEGSPDPVTVTWQASGVSDDVTVSIVMNGQVIHSGVTTASSGSYTWQQPAVKFGQSYAQYADCQARVASVIDSGVEGTSPSFAIIPWGTVVQEWNGLQVYSNYPQPNWIVLGIAGIPVLGDSGAGIRYQCDELAQRWTTQVEHWQDENGRPLPDHWAGLFAKDMLSVAQTYGLPTVLNDHSATAPPQTGDLLVWDTGPYGHVAVVGGVEGYRLRIYEQNGANLQGTRTLALGADLATGKVWVDEEGVIGWIQPLAAATYTDIASSPYREAIETLAAAGIVSGYPDGTFRPDNPVTRQQFAKIIIKTLGYPVSEADVCPFTDVPKGVDPSDPLYPDKYVAVCAEYGITQGKTPTLFAPYANMTRAQLITMAVRAARLAEPPADYTPPFGDFSPDHYPSAREAAYAGLLDGLEGMGPDYDFWAPASRGEVVQVIYGLLMSLPGS